MSTEDIEKTAINILEHEILRYSDCLSPYINSNDRTPFWDGMIYVYNSKDKTRLNFENKIDVQIKGRNVTDFKDNNTYQINVEYLKGYKKEVKGTLLFVVDFINITNYKIYYCYLLPVDLYGILKEIKENQKTVSLKLKKVEIDGPLNLRNVCLNFYKNSNKQAGIRIISSNELEDVKELTAEVIATKESFDYYIENGDVYTYVKLANNEEVATTKGIFKTMKSYNYDIFINDKKYYNKVTFIGLNVEETIIGPLTLNFCENKLYYKIEGSLKKRIKDIKFLIDVFKYKYFIIEDKRFDFHFNDLDEINEKISFFNKRLDYYKKIEKVFKIFRIDFDLDLDSLSSQDFKNLHALLNMYDGRFKDGVDKFGKYVITIGKYNLLVFKADNKIMNYYSQEILDNIVCFLSKDGTGITSIYSYITLEEILNISNFNEKIVFQSIKNVKMTEEYSAIVNLVALTFITAYDISKDIKYLNLADKIIQLILKSINDYGVIINSKQIKYRKKSLSSNDKRILKQISELPENEKDYMLKCSVDILLENNYSFEEHYKLMSANDKKIFKNYPIYNLKKHN